MRAASFTTFNPRYVLLSGSLGFTIALILFTWRYPLAGDQVGKVFVSAQQFYVWIMLFAVLCCILTIFFLPLWGMLIMLVKNPMISKDQERERRNILMLILDAILLTIAVSMLLRFFESIPDAVLERYVPQGHDERMFFMFFFTYITALPALLGTLLINTAAGEISIRIDEAGQTEARLFPLIGEILYFRTLLQNYLVIMGLILSMIPITTAGLRSILIELNPVNEQDFPITYVILFGLIFTILLLLIYVPTHMALTEVSRKLRDRLCPLDTSASLTKDQDQRKALDELLQTNVGIAQNLKSGLVTLAPLATSLLMSLLNINIPL